MRTTRGHARGAYVDSSGTLWLGACHLCAWRYGPTTVADRVLDACGKHDRDAHGRGLQASKQRTSRRRRAA